MLSNSKTLFALVIVSAMFFSCSNTNKVIVETAGDANNTIRGLVQDDRTEAPVADVTIWVEGTTIMSKTNEQGEYSLKVPSGYYAVLARKQGYESKLKDLNAENKNQSVNDFNFSLIQKANRGSYVQKSSVNTRLEAETPKEMMLIQRIDSLEQVIDRLELKLYGQTSSKYADAGELAGYTDQETMNEYVASNKNIDEEAVSKFIKHYINDDLNCKLVNPGVLEFSKSEQDGVQWVNGPMTLKVMNYDLGYEVTVELEEYVSKEYSEILGVNVDAEYYFEEMTPNDTQQAEMWEDNRKKYFAGSLRHFLIAMASDKAPLYFGYRLYSGQFVSNTSAMAYSSSNVTDIEVEKYETFFPSFSNSNSTIMQFEEELRVEYIEKGVDDPDQIMGLRDYKFQTSWLSLNSREAEFTANGILESADAIEVKGVWRYTPVCKMLPNDYLPKLKK